MIGIIPAAGEGSRIQPLAFSKEMLPVGSQIDDTGRRRPKAVSEFLLDRMVIAGADRVCFVISPEKDDIIPYYAKHREGQRLCYIVQETPLGLCDSLFRAASLVRPEEDVLVGLPDTVWFPEDGFRRLPNGEFSFLLFHVERAEQFASVLLDEEGLVRRIDVKRAKPASPWIWGAFRLSGAAFQELHRLWCEPGRRDEYVGTLVNAFLAGGGSARGVKAGEGYHDIGTLEGYRAAVALLAEREPKPAPA